MPRSTLVYRSVKAVEYHAAFISPMVSPMVYPFEYWHQAQWHGDAADSAERFMALFALH